MRKIFIPIFFSLLAISTWQLSNHAIAAPQEKPLMVVRFSDTAVNFEQSLDKAIKMAIAAKPAVSFDLLAISPENTDRKINKKNQQNTKFIAEQIAAQIEQAGIDGSNIRTNFKTSTLVNTNEIQIFVQ